MCVYVYACVWYVCVCVDVIVMVKRTQINDLCFGLKITKISGQASLRDMNIAIPS